MQDAFGGINRFGDIGKHLFQAVLNLVYIYIAYDNYCLQIRTVPFFVIGTYFIVLKIIDYVDGPDGHAVGIPATGKHFG